MKSAKYSAKSLEIKVCFDRIDTKMSQVQCACFDDTFYLDERISANSPMPNMLFT